MVIPRWVERWMQKCIDAYDRKYGMKTRAEAFKELVEGDMAYQDLQHRVGKLPPGVFDGMVGLYEIDTAAIGGEPQPLGYAAQAALLAQVLQVASLRGEPARKLLDYEAHDLLADALHDAIEERRNKLGTYLRKPLREVVKDAAEGIGL